MNINAIVSGAKFAISRTGLILSKHAPDILTSAGVVGFVGTAVLASKATLEINDVLEPHLNDLEKINAGINNPDIYPEKYTAEAAKRDKIIVYTRIVTDIAKKYAPTIILGVASAACVFSANNIMKKRLAGAIAAYEAVDKAYRVYKKRVKDVLGEEASRKVSSVLYSWGVCCGMGHSLFIRVSSAYKWVCRGVFQAGVRRISAVMPCVFFARCCIATKGETR